MTGLVSTISPMDENRMINIFKNADLKWTQK